VEILKVVEAYQAYQEMLLYYGVKTLSAHCLATGQSIASFQEKEAIRREDWLNVGGQLVPASRVEQLKADLKDRVLSSWDDVHHTYDAWFASYEEDRAIHALATLYQALGTNQINNGQWEDLVENVARIRLHIENQVFKTKEKDFNNRFRESTYRNLAERDAVLGSLDDNPFIQESRQITEQVLLQIRSVSFA
jgi:hypothetical protein